MIGDRFALQAWAKAEIHLVEAGMQNVETTPGATVHLAYYAMFHAARAVLLRTNGSAPKKHASVIQQFGYLARNRSSELMRAGHDMNQVEERRIIADYDEARMPTPDDADSALGKARAFLDLCAREFGFSRETKPEK